VEVAGQPAWLVVASSDWVTRDVSSPLAEQLEVERGREAHRCNPKVQVEAAPGSDEAALMPASHGVDLKPGGEFIRIAPIDLQALRTRTRESLCSEAKEEYRSLIDSGRACQADADCQLIAPPPLADAGTCRLSVNAGIGGDVLAELRDLLEFACATGTKGAGVHCDRSHTYRAVCRANRCDVID
jgi:hypothetical protein